MPSVVLGAGVGCPIDRTVMMLVMTLDAQLPSHTRSLSYLFAHSLSEPHIISRMHFQKHTHTLHYWVTLNVLLLTREPTHFVFSCSFAH
eukprot:m.398465 g.398465  ORF g.398465 m.398465 type:complete len:89 (+) comp16774_c1_seq14:263-529(+)